MTAVLFLLFGHIFSEKAMDPPLFCCIFLWTVDSQTSISRQKESFKPDYR